MRDALDLLAAIAVICGSILMDAAVMLAVTIPIWGPVVMIVWLLS